LAGAGSATSADLRDALATVGSGKPLRDAPAVGRVTSYFTR